MSHHPITPADRSPGTTGSWQDVDVSADIPAGATGISGLIINTNTGTKYDFGVRKKGSTDNRIQQTEIGDRGPFYIGVDANRVFQAFIENAALQVIVTGWFDSDCIFFTNAVAKPAGSTSAWLNVDISTDTGADVALGAFVEWASSDAQSHGAGLRKNGSTDNRTAGYLPHRFAVVGCDGNEIFQQWIANLNQDLWVGGYVKANAVFHTNGIDRSPGSVDTFVDLAALPAGAVSGIYEVYNTNGGSGWNYTYSLRPKGETFDYYNRQQTHNWDIVGCDGNGVAQAKISNLNADIYELGYFTAAGGLAPKARHLQQMMAA